RGEGGGGAGRLPRPPGRSGAQGRRRDADHRRPRQRRADVRRCHRPAAHRAHHQPGAAGVSGPPCRAHAGRRAVRHRADAAAPDGPGNPAPDDRQAAGAADRRRGMRLTAACRRPRAHRMRQVLLCALLVLPIAAGAAADAEQKKEELEALRARIQRVQRDLARDLGQRDELTAELRRTEEELARTATALREANLSLQFKQERLQALEAEQRARKAGLAAERDALAGQVRAAYMAGREEKMKLLLNQQDPVSFGRVLTYYDYLNRARTARIERVNRQLARLRELEGEIAQEVADLNRVRAERERILASLESTRDQRAGLLAQVDARIRDRNSELRQLQRDEQALSELVKSLMDVFADIPAQLSDRASFRDLRGKLEWPSNGQVVASFGAPRA